MKFLPWQTLTIQTDKLLIVHCPWPKQIPQDPKDSKDSPRKCSSKNFCLLDAWFVQVAHSFGRSKIWATWNNWATSSNHIQRITSPPNTCTSMSFLAPSWKGKGCPAGTMAFVQPTSKFAAASTQFVFVACRDLSAYQFVVSTIQEGSLGILHNEVHKCAKIGTPSKENWQMCYRKWSAKNSQHTRTRTVSFSCCLYKTTSTNATFVQTSQTFTATPWPVPCFWMLVHEILMKYISSVNLQPQQNNQPYRNKTTQTLLHSLQETCTAAVE